MKTSTYLMAAGLGSVGILTGFAAKRLTATTSANGADTPTSQSSKSRSPDETSTGMPASARRRQTNATSGTLPHSADTLETILALGDKNTYGRLALWLMDANEQEIASYWQHYRQQKESNNDTADLIFINWARLNPEGAITAATGTPNEQHAWWAWACHDPETALATALARKVDGIQNVAWGIGEFHGEWLRAHFDEIPESARRMALMGLTKWDDGPDPLETLKFLKKHNAGFRSSIFNSLVRKDPWAAYDWIQENSESNSQGMSSFVQTMSQVHPDLLDRLAQQTPSGALKREMESAAFESLLKSDPDAALEKAKATKAPIVAVERLSAAGMKLISSDLDQSFEIAKSLFKISPDALLGKSTVMFPNGKATSLSGNDEASQFINALLAKDPAKVMAMAPPPGDANSQSTFSKLAKTWVQADMIGFTTWVNNQTDPAIHEPATKTLVKQLTSEGHFPDAADWAMSLTQSRESSLRSLFARWQRTNPDEARVWLETADLTKQESHKLQQIIEQQ